MKTPTVHLNGTSAKALLQQNRDAIVALDAAMDTMAQGAPHPRDYYVQGETAYTEARLEYCARLDKVRQVRDELLELLENIQDQVDSRERK